MKKLIVVGPGCNRCRSLAAATRQAADQLGIDYELEEITEIKQFARYGVMMTPGLVVDGELKVHGKVPTVDELVALLR
jgi:small redox-active disulfide protein 2